MSNANQDKQLLQKEQELQKVLADFYSYDLTELKKDLSSLVQQETKKITEDKDQKVKALQDNFKRLLKLQQDHIVQKVQVQDPRERLAEESILEFRKRSEMYEKLVAEVTLKKVEVRAEIAKMEIELRSLRDQIQQKELENKNLHYLVSKEEELKKKKASLEEQALRSLGSDMQEQLKEMQSEAQQITGKVTPYGFEQSLNEIFKRRSEGYNTFVDEAIKDCRDREKQVDKEKITLEKEVIITQGLQREVDDIQRQHDNLKSDYDTLKKQLDEINWQHDHKLKQMDEARQQANNDIRKLSLELSHSQSEINMLILESQKYDSMLVFLANEREMILKAVLDGEEVDPLYQVTDLYAEEAKRKKIENKISNFQKQWQHAVLQGFGDIYKDSNDTQMKEYRARLAILGAELNEKNDMIASIEKEKNAIEELSARAMSMGMSISDQSAEIERLNERYRQTLNDKMQLYPELQESVKELTMRDNRYLANELDATSLVNESSIIKRELEQKEREIEELWQEISSFNEEGADTITEQITQKVSNKLSNLRQARKQLRDQENECEFFEFLLRERENEFQEAKIKSQVNLDLQNAVKQTLQVKPKKKQLGKGPIQVLESHKKNLESLLIQQQIQENKYENLGNSDDESPTQEGRRRLEPVRDISTRLMKK